MSKLIVVADAGRAVLLSQTKVNVLPELVAEIDNPRGRLHARDLVSDRPGSSATDGKGRHAMEAHTDPTDVEEDRFARSLADRIASELGKDASCVLVMSPRFLGRVRGMLQEGVKKRVAVEIAKDFAHLSTHELRTRVHEELLRA